MGRWVGGRFDRSKFQDNNLITFAPSWTEEQQDWWHERMFEPFGIYPEELGEMLSASAPGAKAITMRNLSIANDSFEIEVRGEIGETGRIWFHERGLDLQGAFFEARKMMIPPPDQGKGMGRLLMADLVDTALRLNIRRINIEAEKVGRYAWVNLGFLPERDSWNRIQVDIRRRLKMANRLSAEKMAAYLEVVDSSDVKAIREVASWRDMVDSHVEYDERGLPASVPLGPALLLEGQTDWYGELDLENSQSMKIFHDYVRRSQNEV